jgi:hypothetical protein
MAVTIMSDAKMTPNNGIVGYCNNDVSGVA